MHAACDHSFKTLLREEWQRTVGHECEEAVKKWPLYIINGGLQAAVGLLQRHQLTATPAMYAVAYELEAAQAAFTQTVLPRYRSQLSSTFANRAFYAIEHVECLAMQTFLVQLQMRVTLSSVIWLHDGVWIPNEVSGDDIRFAERATLSALSLAEDDERLFQVRKLDSLAECATRELSLALRQAASVKGRSSAAPAHTRDHRHPRVQAAQASHNNDNEYLDIEWAKDSGWSEQKCFSG